MKTMKANPLEVVFLHDESKDGTKLYRANSGVKLEITNGELVAIYNVRGVRLTIAEDKKSILRTHKFAKEWLSADGNSFVVNMTVVGVVSAERAQYTVSYETLKHFMKGHSVDAILDAESESSRTLGIILTRIGRETLERYMRTYHSSTPMTVVAEKPRRRLETYVAYDHPEEGHNATYARVEHWVHFNVGALKRFTLTHKISKLLVTPDGEPEVRAEFTLESHNGMYECVDYAYGTENPKLLAHRLTCMFESVLGDDSPYAHACDCC